MWTLSPGYCIPPSVWFKLSLTPCDRSCVCPSRSDPSHQGGPGPHLELSWLLGPKGGILFHLLPLYKHMLRVARCENCIFYRNTEDEDYVCSFSFFMNTVLINLVSWFPQCHHPSYLPNKTNHQPRTFSFIVMRIPVQFTCQTCPFPEVLPANESHCTAQYRASGN